MNNSSGTIKIETHSDLWTPLLNAPKKLQSLNEVLDNILSMRSQSHALATTDGAETKILKNLIIQLGADSYSTRQEAFNKLSGKPEAEEFLRKTLKGIQDQHENTPIRSGDRAEIIHSIEKLTKSFENDRIRRFSRLIERLEKTIPEEPVKKIFFDQEAAKFVQNAKPLFDELFQTAPDFNDIFETTPNATQVQVIKTLQKIGKSGVPALIQALEKGDNGLKMSAACALGNIGPDAKSAVPALIQAVEKGDVELKGFATSALGRIGPDAKSAVPALIQALEKGDDVLKVITSRALGEIGPDAKNAVPALIKALEIGDPEVKDCAIVALGKIGPDAKGAVPALVKVLENDDGSSKFIAAVALARIGHIGLNARTAVSVLVQELESGEFKRDAATALGAIELHAEDKEKVSKALNSAALNATNVLNDPDEVARDAAKAALETIKRRDEANKDNQESGIKKTGAEKLPKKGLQFLFSEGNHLLLGNLSAPEVPNTPSSAKHIS